MANKLMLNIVFDLDGTLIDSAPDLHRVANLVLSGQGCKAITLAQARNYMGSGTSVFIEKMRNERDLPDSLHDQLLADFLEHYMDAYELTTVYPSVFDALEQLKLNGHLLGICTNKPIEPCHAVLKNLKLDGFFDVVIGGDSLSVRKPDPTPLHAVLSALNPSRHGLYVGDSEVDALTAQRASVPFLLFTEGYRKTDVEEINYTENFSNFNELVDIVSKH